MQKVTYSVALVDTTGAKAGPEGVVSTVNTVSNREAAVAITSCLTRGLKLSLDDGRLVVSPKSLIDDEVRSIIRANRDGMIRLLSMEGHCTEIPGYDYFPEHVSAAPPSTEPVKVTKPREWPVDAAALIEWYVENRDSVPQAPFDLSPGVSVTGRDVFLAALDRDIAAGPSGPRHRALPEELATLRAVMFDPVARYRFEPARPDEGPLTNFVEGRF